MLMEEEEVAPPPPLLRPLPDHPPYSEMVQCAIRALAEPHGSTEPSISSHIKAHYDSLPWAHSKLLPYYLNKLVLAGEISKSPRSRNRYVLPRTLVSPNPRNPRSPAKRVRGKGVRGRPKKVIPCKADVEEDDKAKLVVSPNPKLEIVGRDPAVKGGRGRPPKITPHAYCELNSESVQKGGGNGPELIVNPSPHPDPNAQILLRDPIIECSHGSSCKVSPYADGEPNSESAGKGEPNSKSELLHQHLTINGGCGSVEKGSENRGGLNVNPEPNHLRVGLPVNCHGRPPKVASFDLNREADHDPNSLFTEPELDCSGESPRLVLKLKSTEEIGGDGGDVTGGCMCLNEEQSKGRELEIVKVEGGNEEVLALKEKVLNAVEVDDHFEELTLQEKGLCGIKFDEHDEGSLAGHDGENGLDEIKTDGQNDETLPLKANSLNCIKVDEHNEELVLPLQVKQDSNGIDKDNEEILMVQEKDLNVIEPDVCNGDLLALEERGLEGTEIDEHNEELLVSKVVVDAKSSKSKSDQWSLKKKARTKKRRLWYEG